MGRLAVALALLCAVPIEANAGPLESAQHLMAAGRADAAMGLLVGAWPRLEEGATRDVARYLLGKRLVERGEVAGLDHIEALPEPFGLTDDRRLVWRARGLALTERHEETLAALERAVPVSAHASERASLRLAKAAVLVHLDGAPRAASELEAVAKSKAPRHLRSRALLELVRLHAATNKGASRRAARRLVVHYPDTVAGRAEDVPLAVADLSDQDRMRRARVLMTHFVYEEARAEFRRLADHPRFRADARWRIGLIGLRKLRDDAEEARRMFRWVVAHRGEHAEEALFLLMRSYIKVDRYDEALKVADRYARRHPRGEFRAQVAYYRAWLPYDQRNCAVAIPRLRRYLKRHPYRRTYAHGFLGWCQIRRGDWKAAVDDYELLAKISGALHRGKAWYWQAFALHELGRKDEAIAKIARLRKVYPLTWYDILGQQMLARWQGRDPRASSLPWPEGGGDLASRHPLDPSAWRWPQLGETLGRRFDRVRQLVALAEPTLARRAYAGSRSAIERAVPAAKRHAFVRFMGHAVEDFKHGWAMVSGGWLGAMMRLPSEPDASWLLAYPHAYKPLVEAQAPDFGLSPYFVWSIMRQESRYHPAMISAMDAIGALQMIPQTAEIIGQERQIPYDPVTFPDPRHGFPFSFFYMRKHDATWKGQLVLTAASYNAGPAPIARWLRENPDAQLAELVEEFSYNEARAYARKVAEHMLRYLWLYESDPEVRGEALDRLFPVVLNRDIADDVGY